ncbi:unnamed protein product [Lactuca virosa]|uniref:Uncharacterized protein n=1 Tax=Lactuca virosa TaxID=75947 RepID=A0AAU9MDL8_9ASTR|nr:unnamed protein product [Lactuca virosa]
MRWEVLVDSKSGGVGAPHYVKIFLNNKGSRTTSLEHGFNNLTLRATTSLEAYCQCLKDLASQLQDVECPVTENRLVLQLVCGLPSEFNLVVAYIHQTLPSWDTTCSMLQLEYQRQRARDSHSLTEVAATVDHEPTPNREQHRDPPAANRSRQSHQRPYNRRLSPSGSQNRSTNQKPGQSTNLHPNNRRGQTSGQQ